MRTFCFLMRGSCPEIVPSYRSMDLEIWTHHIPLLSRKVGAPAGRSVSHSSLTNYRAPPICHCASAVRLTRKGFNWRKLIVVTPPLALTACSLLDALCLAHAVQGKACRCVRHMNKRNHTCPIVHMCILGSPSLKCTQLLFEWAALPPFMGPSERGPNEV